MAKHIFSFVLSFISFVHIATSFTLREQQPDKVCHWNDKCSYNYFSTKTYYDAIRGDIRDWSLNGLVACSPIALWSLNRHGTRNPGDSSTEDMKNISVIKELILSSHDSGKGSLCSQDAENLRAWKWLEELEFTQSYLTESGYVEIRDIAYRLKQKFPELIDKDFDENIFQFRPTNEQRTIASADAFVEGLFGIDNNATIEMPRDRDEVIRPYEDCEIWQMAKNGAERLVQANEYYESEEFNKVINGLQSRLGIDYPITAADVIALYDLCRFPKSWNPSDVSPWCAIFTEEDFIIIEYVDDILHYYRNGHGTYLNAKLGATAVKDLYDSFNYVRTNGQSKVKAYFTHDTMIEMVYAAMGLFYDGYDLKANDRREDRVFRTSQIAAFSSNILSVMYQCADRQNRIAFFVNEKPVSVCGGEFCTWDDFKIKFESFHDTNLDFCDV